MYFLSTDAQIFKCGLPFLRVGFDNCCNVTLFCQLVKASIREIPIYLSKPRGKEGCSGGGAPGGEAYPFQKYSTTKILQICCAKLFQSYHYNNVGCRMERFRYVRIFGFKLNPLFSEHLLMSHSMYLFIVRLFL